MIGLALIAASLALGFTAIYLERKFFPLPTTTPDRPARSTLAPVALETMQIIRRVDEWGEFLFNSLLEIYNAIQSQGGNMSTLTDAVNDLVSAVTTEADQAHAKIDDLEAQLARALDLDANPEVQAAITALRGATDSVKNIVVDQAQAVTDADAATTADVAEAPTSSTDPSGASEPPA